MPVAYSYYALCVKLSSTSAKFRKNELLKSDLKLKKSNCNSKLQFAGTTETKTVHP